MADQVQAPGAAVPLTPEELKALTDDLQAVLEKHGAEIGVTSTINLLKTAVVAAPVVPSDDVKKENNGEAKPVSETKKSS